MKASLRYNEENIKNLISKIKSYKKHEEPAVETKLKIKSPSCTRYLSALACQVCFEELLTEKELTIHNAFDCKLRSEPRLPKPLLKRWDSI